MGDNLHTALFFLFLVFANLKFNKCYDLRTFPNLFYAWPFDAENFKNLKISLNLFVTY
jgi:hypothetical protein